MQRAGKKILRSLITIVARKILTSGLFNFSISVINKQTRFQTLKTTGLGAMKGAMSLGVDTLKVLAGTSEFQVGSYIDIVNIG